MRAVAACELTTTETMDSDNANVQGCCVTISTILALNCGIAYWK
ncbi:protein of unknown function [Moritella yayanosii]|uniref:Uncharacterized protein n=1 Tax=Moritella yayanosii TaxID=69539 RepID=A0A330LNK5_9GAMM|nr:protein of unknown function [Moritella yayanosii]